MKKGGFLGESQHIGMKETPAFWAIPTNWNDCRGDDERARPNKTKEKLALGKKCYALARQRASEKQIYFFVRIFLFSSALWGASQSSQTKRNFFLRDSWRLARR
jgi:hypothetical protein